MSQGLESSMEWVQGEVKRADNLMGEEKYAEAIAALEGAIAMLQQGGYGHASIAWRLAMAYDMAGQLDDAYRLIREALAAEPASPEIAHSRKVISRRLREAVAAGQTPDLEASYALLRDTGQADAACHLAMATLLAKEERFDRAERLLAALVTLHPSSIEAWELRGAVAEARGDDSLAKSCRSMAQSGGNMEPGATQAAATA